LNEPTVSLGFDGNGAGTECLFTDPRPLYPQTDTRLAQSTVYGTREFSVVSQPDYVKEEDVYVVESEMELAMTARLLFDEGILMFYYEDRNLSLNRTYDYLDAIMIHAFKFSMGTKTYTQGDTVIKALDYVKIELFNDQRTVVDQHIATFVETYGLQGDEPSIIRAINKGLVLETQYDTSILDLDLSAITDHTSFEAYGLFEFDTAVCSGYAKAFLGVAEAVDIPAIVVASRTMNHAWNLVHDGQDWVYVDSTYNDPIPDKRGRVLTTYLMVDEATLVSGLDGNDGHVFDTGGDTGLSAAEYVAYAQYLYPNP
jgi:transglutaminase/protease-like cytokinesis protein 3